MEERSERLLLSDEKWKGEEEAEEEGLRQRIWKENKKMWIVAGPAIFTRFSTFGVSFITQAFIGHVGRVELAAYALVFTVLTRFANGVLLGMASALETLCGQSFGAKEYRMLGIYLQRSWVILLCCTILLLPIYVFTAPILRFLGQAEDIAAMAGTISLWIIPIIFSFVFSFTFQMYLQSQSKNLIISFLAAFSLGLHIILSWLTVFKLSMGVSGAMISMILAMWIPIFGQFAFVLGGGCPDTWKGFSTSAFSDLWPVIKLSLSSGAMLCLELWYNTILVLLTGHMKNAEVEIDALAICLNINGLEMMISLGFLAAAGVRVANELGAGSAKAAKFSIIVVVATSFSVGLVLFCVFMLVRGRVAYLFTDNIEVVREVDHLSPLLSFSILLNSIQPVLSGVAIGAGWQSVVAYVNITCYYAIGIPIGVLLGYLIGFQVKGIWIGMLLGTFAQTVVLIIITLRTDWDNQVALAKARVKKWTVGTSEDNDESA
ncbi:protein DETOXIFICATION 21-like [Curcuma longa]|uniref:protein DETOXIFICATION 21-like n=1 Tax=Curcuma longa TaxID=136217 RepID=UPI003D9E5F4E